MSLTNGSHDSDRNESMRNRRHKKSLRRQERSAANGAVQQTTSPEQQHGLAVDDAPVEAPSVETVLNSLDLSDLSPNPSDLGDDIATDPAGHLSEASAEASSSAELSQLSSENEELKNDLLAKEELITALTDRLEQAAEQLDRLRRSGADRGWRGGGGMPSDVIQDQRAAVEELKQIAARFDEMQAATTLGRLEMQVSELRDLIVALPQTSSRTDNGAQKPATLSGPAGATGFAPPRPGGGTWWDRQKAAMLDESPPDESDNSSTEMPAEAIAECDSDDQGSRSCLPDFSGFTFEISPLPPEPDWESLTLETACELLRQRDALIAELREPLVQAEMANLFSQGFGSVELLPDDLRTELSDLQDQWEVRFRKHETELSIERARLAREQMQAKQLQEQLRKQLAESGASHGKNGEGESRAERRWFRFMGQQDRSNGQNS